MADKIVQLVDKDGDNIYPVASVPHGASITLTDTDPGEGGTLAADSLVGVYDIENKVSTNMIADGAVITNKIANEAVTSSKVDWTTMGEQTVTILKFNKQSTQNGTMTKTTLKGTELTIQWVNYGQRFCITSGGSNINHLRQSYIVVPEGNTTTGSYLLGGLASGSKTYTYGNGILNGTNYANYSRGGINVTAGIFDYYSNFIDVGGGKAFTTAMVNFARGNGETWNCLGTAMSSGLACYISFGAECTTGPGMLPHFCQGATGSPRRVEVVYEIFE